MTTKNSNLNQQLVDIFADHKHCRRTRIVSLLLFCRFCGATYL